MQTNVLLPGKSKLQGSPSFSIEYNPRTTHQSPEAHGPLYNSLSQNTYILGYIVLVRTSPESRLLSVFSQLSTNCTPPPYPCHQLNQVRTPLARVLTRDQVHQRACMALLGCLPSPLQTHLSWRTGEFLSQGKVISWVTCGKSELEKN